MPDLNVFARRIRALGERIETNVDKLVIKTAIAVGQTVVLGTPVDTGRARANWQVGISQPITQVTDELDPSGGATIAANNAKISRRRPGLDIYISNNLPYIGSLNEGSSAQAPAGFVETAVRVGAAAVKGTKVVK